MLVYIRLGFQSKRSCKTITTNFQLHSQYQEVFSFTELLFFHMFKWIPQGG